MEAGGERIRSTKAFNSSFEALASNLVSGSAKEYGVQQLEYE